MPEKLRHPGFFRRIFFGERPTQEQESEIEEFKAVKRTLHLRRGLRIFYPASGTDISPSYGFRGAHVYYNDTNAGVISALSQAKLGWRGRTIIKGDGRNPQNQPENVDMVILRNETLEESNGKEDSRALIRPLKKGGYVISNAWGNASTASELATMEDMELVGVLLRTNRNGRKKLVTYNRGEIKEKLIAERDELMGTYAGKTFVFRKK